MRNILKECGGASGLFAASVAVLAGALFIRYGLLEAGVFPTDCGGALAEGLSGWCGLKWAVVQSFIHQRLGWFSLVLGVAAFLFRHRRLAGGGWLAGLAGLVLYSFDPSAVGALLSLLVLARRPAQRRRDKEEAGGEPGDGLRVGGLR